MTVIQSSKPLLYVLKSITNCEPPFDSKDSNWFQYKILQGSNIITGYKCGEYAHVLESIEVNIDRLNQRQKGKYVVMSSSKPKS